MGQQWWKLRRLGKEYWVCGQAKGPMILPNCAKKQTTSQMSHASASRPGTVEQNNLNRGTKKKKDEIFGK